ncbi:cleavage and polyadenylation specificity factor subunit 3-like isoform X2 [Micropterus salmoides]|uniref:cleavage and polyadenylation specificity factor subunit 3-like isoform X3 n=1 Tax=Micropterus salmoides TaxID=27706 RepID=UPI0018EE3EBE|nr:cleavage and polyadenylation specificity factor subunit 3-like isoform X3 [Micropterus salmoides]XP_038583611.1 cleavage and polyadenylation specificity factor subunit 3-like isoform X2 [Micropterus salmoides]
MASKRKCDATVPAEESDQLLIRPLGAGQEVGRSCIILEFKGPKILLDCGIHPGLDGMDALPYIDLIDPAEIDLLLISHFHLDHCGALPWFLQKTSFKGRTFMTHATKAIYRWLLSDYVKVSNISADDMLSRRRTWRRAWRRWRPSTSTVRTVTSGEHSGQKHHPEGRREETARSGARGLDCGKGLQEKGLAGGPGHFRYC